MKPVAVAGSPLDSADEESVEEVGSVPLELVVTDDQPGTDLAVPKEDPAAPAVVFTVPSDDVCLETWKFDASPNGLIRRVVAHFGHLFSFRPAEDAWLRWDEKTYVTDVKNMEIMDAVRCVAESIVHVEAKLLAANHPDVLTLQQELRTALTQSSEEAKEIAARLRSLKRKLESDHKNYGMRCQVETSVRAAATGAQKYLSVPEAQWDGPKHLLNVQNGVVNLRTGELLPHRRSYRFTQITKCNYEADAEIDALDNVLDHLSDSRIDVQEYVQRWIGQGITGEVSAASILYVFGAAQVGKSTLFNAVMFMMGEGGDSAVSFASTAKPEAFMKKTASHDEGFHHLRRCRLVVIIEMQGGMLDNSKLKAISGGDSWDSRKAGGSTEKYFPRMSIMMTSNKLTVVAPEDKGLMERFQPYKVTRPLPRAKRSNSVKEAMQSQKGMESILAWAVKGAIKWYADGANNDALKAPAFFADELSDYTRDMDTLQGWMGDNIVLVDKEHAAGYPAKAVDLWKNYEEYVKGKGMKKTSFYRELSEIGFTRTAKTRWTLRAGSSKGKTQPPAFWIPGLYVATGWGTYGFGDNTEELGGNVPLDPHDVYDNGCEGPGCTGCRSARCTAGTRGQEVIAFPALNDRADAA
jgi:putative DNA primase/helicase